MGGMRILQGGIDLATPLVPFLERTAPPDVECGENSLEAATSRIVPPGPGQEVEKGVSTGPPSNPVPFSTGLLPAELDAILLEAPFTAARQLFDAAIENNVDLVILTGRLCPPAQDRRGAWFLKTQFQRLHDTGIDVVWASDSKPDMFKREWAGWFDLPPNVRTLPARHAIGFRLTRSSRLVEVEWADVDGEQRVHGAAAELVIRLAQATAQAQPKIAVQYESQGADTPFVVPLPDPVSIHRGGASLVECEFAGTCQKRSITTSSVFLVDETLSVTVDPGWTALRQRLRSLLHGCRQQVESEQLVLVHWTLTGTGPVWERLLQPVEFSSLMRDLRQEGMRHSPAVWVTGLTLSPSPAQFAEWKTSEPVAIALQELATACGTAGGPTVADGEIQSGNGNAKAPARLASTSRNQETGRLQAGAHRAEISIASRMDAPAMPGSQDLMSHRSPFDPGIYDRIQLRLVRELLAPARTVS